MKVLGVPDVPTKMHVDVSLTIVTGVFGYEKKIVCEFLHVSVVTSLVTFDDSHISL